jgi:hypothetical protein
MFVMMLLTLAREYESTCCCDIFLADLLFKCALFDQLTNAKGRVS